MLSLVILVIITSNVILWSYQMNQLDWEKMQENIEITDVAWVNSSSLFSFHNKGASTGHIVSIWVMNSTVHERYETDIFVNSGERLNYTRTDLALPSSSYFVKAVTERGNIAVYSAS